MQFPIEVLYQRKRFRMMAEQVFCNKAIEHFKISAGSKYILLQSNRPLLQAKGLKHRKPQWKVLQGTVLYFSALQLTIEALEKGISNHLANKPQPEH